MRLLPNWDIYFEGGVPKGTHTTNPSTICTLTNCRFKSLSELAESLEEAISNEHIKREIIVGTFTKEPTEDDMFNSILIGKEEYGYDNILEIKCLFRERTEEEISELYYSGEEEVTDVEYNLSVVSLMAKPAVEDEYDFEEDLEDLDYAPGVELPEVPDYDDDFNDEVDFNEEVVEDFSTEY